MTGGESMAVPGDEDEQRLGFRLALEGAPVTLEQIWIRYFGLGGKAGLTEVQAYVHGALNFLFLNAIYWHTPLMNLSMPLGSTVSVPAPPTAATSTRGQMKADRARTDKGATSLCYHSAGAPSMERVDTGERRHGPGPGHGHQLIIDQEDITAFLTGLIGRAAASVSRLVGVPTVCALTMYQHQHRGTVAGSSQEALVLDRIEQYLGQGPCLDALRTKTPVLLVDTAPDRRWHRYSARLSAAGCSSVAAIPVAVRETASSCLNFYAPMAGAFTKEATGEAALFAQIAGQALSLSFRTADAERLAEDLRSAMESRTDIDLACGLIMGRNQCSQQEAYQFLIRASNTRNMKVHEVALKIIHQLSGTRQTTTHFES